MRALLLIALAALVISSCKKEKEDIDTRPPVRLSKIVTKAKDRITELSLKYNESGYIIEINDRIKSLNSNNSERLRKVVYTYSADNLITQEQITDPVTGAFAGFYEYNERNQLYKVKYTLYGMLDESYVQYTWDDSNILHAVTFTGLGLPQKKIILFDAKGNVAETTYQFTSSGINDRCFNIRYDDHPNYMRTIKGLNNYVYFFGFVPQTLSENNVVSYDWETNEENIDDHSNAYKLSYNHYGYVEKEENVETAEVREFYYEIVP